MKNVPGYQQSDWWPEILIIVIMVNILVAANFKIVIVYYIDDNNRKLSERFMFNVLSFQEFIVIMLFVTAILISS